jgi:hypothetical protein
VYTPIKSGNAVSLFLQAIIYMLKVGGKGAVVLPDGQDLFSKTNASLIAVREYLMKTCELKEVIYLPAGIFTHTSIRTCVVYFVKKREGTEVLTVSGEEKPKRAFVETLQTSEVAFYDYEPTNETKTLLARVPIDAIVRNAYALNCKEYLVRDDTTSIKYADGVVVRTLGDVCSIDQGTTLPRTAMLDGAYKVIGGGKIIGTHNTTNRAGEEFTITRVGDLTIHYIDEPYYLTDNGFALKSITKNILTKYIYYLLSNNKPWLIGLYKGAAQKVISKTNLKSLKIPIPSLERQREIVHYCETNDQLIAKLEADIVRTISETTALINSIGI